MEDLGPPPSPQDLDYPTDDIPSHRDDNFDYANNEQGGNENNGDDHPPPGHPLDGDDDANHVDVDDPAVQQAVHAALDAASPAPAPVSLSTSLPTFSELDGGHDHDHHVVMSLPEADDSHLHASSDAFLDDDDPYAQQYTSASVPVPPMMDWHHEAPPPSDHSSQGPAQVAAPNPIRNAMGLHSPIVSADAEHRQAPTEPAVSSAAAAAPPMPRAPPPPPSSEHNMYTSYAIAPGPPPHHHHPHHYDPHVPPHSMYAHYPPHAYVMPPPPSQAPPQVPRIPSYAAAAATPKSAPQTNHNSNFWLQEEEERFLLGLRLYGWGQWKRIQTVVQTRSNKQIKSHAQKREKVNPEIKFKYAKGKSRRGRISSKVLASEYSSGPEQEGVAAAAAAAATSLNDPRLPPMEELWKDVYGTNNGVGPNSRLRRYRSNALHQKWLEEVAEKTTDGEAQVAPPLATEKKTKSPTMASSSSSSEPLAQDKAAASAKKKLTPEGQYIHDHKVLERHAMTAPRHPSPGPPLPYYNAPPPPHGHAYPPPPPNYAMPPPGVSPPRMAYPPPQGYPHAGMGHPPPSHLPVLHHGSAPPSTTARAPPAQGVVVASHEEPLRPGMRVYARSKNAPHWYPGIIYSAKVDPNKSIDPHQAAVPLVYHVQFDGGGMREDPEVPEEYILGKARYERALDDLEAYYDLSSSTMGPRGTSSLEGGMPVYAQWMERSNPTSHARWLPGTIDSVRREETPHGPVETYRILFDNAAEKTDVSSECVLERNEYHQLVQRKHAYPPAEGASLRTPIGEIYDLFSRGDANSAGSGQGMDLLFTASQMAAPMDTLKKRDAASMTKEEGGGGAVEDSGEVEESGDAASKRIKTDSEEHLTTSQEENFNL